MIIVERLVEEEVGVAEELWLWLMFSNTPDVWLKAFRWLERSLTPHELNTQNTLAYFKYKLESLLRPFINSSPPRRQCLS